MLISTKGRYALRVMIDLAQNREKEQYIPLKDIAARQEISEKYLESIIATLSKEGLVVGVRGNAGQANYAASKAGLIGLAKSAAKELAGRGITVNCLAPGFIETDMTGALSEAVREKILAEIPAGAFGTPADVAAAAVFLSSRSAGYITGQVLCVDGGMAM